MCVIVTIIMLILSIQNLMSHHWLSGGLQLFIGLGFLLLLLSNIRQVQARREGTCNHGCRLTNWIANLLKKRDS